MAFVDMNEGGTFVVWGKEHAKGKENSYIVEEGKSITCMVTRIKDSPKYGLILEVKSKEYEDPLLILGTTILLSKLGYQKDKETGKAIPLGGVDCVKEEEVIRITFVGMIPTKQGKKAYDFKIEVDR